MALNEAVKREVAELTNMLGTLGADNGDTREKRAKVAQMMDELTRKLSVPGERRGGFDPADADREGRTNRSPVEARLRRKATDDETRRLHELNDSLLIAAGALNVKPTELRMYRDAVEELPVLRRDMDTGGGSFGPYIPTGFSATLHEQVRIEQQVAALFQRIDMPTNPFVIPIEGSDAVAYLLSERGGEDDDLDTTKRVTTGLSSAGGTALTLTAQKVGSRITFSTEAEEDAIISVMPYLKRKFALAIGTQEEDAVLNGDTTGTHMDADITDAKDGRKAWKGLRKNALANSATVDNGASDKTRIRLLDLRLMRQKMGKYGARPGDLAYVVGVAGAIKMLQVEDTQSATNPSPVVTIDKYGPNATVLNGEIARIDGIPIVVSSLVREDLGETGVKLASGTADRTLVLCVNKNAWTFGDRRQIRIASQYIAVTDQQLLVATRRLTFRGYFEADKTVSALRNVQI